MIAFDLKKTFQKAIAKDLEIKKAHEKYSVLITKCENIR